MAKISKDMVSSGLIKYPRYRVFLPEAAVLRAGFNPGDDVSIMATENTIILTRRNAGVD